MNTTRRTFLSAILGIPAIAALPKSARDSIIRFPAGQPEIQIPYTFYGMAAAHKKGIVQLLNSPAPDRFLLNSIGFQFSPDTPYRTVQKALEICCIELLEGTMTQFEVPVYALSMASRPVFAACCPLLRRNASLVLHVLGDLPEEINVHWALQGLVSVSEGRKARKAA